MIQKGVLSKVGEYYFTHKEYADEIMRAMEEFFDASNLRRDKNLPPEKHIKELKSEKKKLLKEKYK
jgi:hypothetical protein